MIYKLYDLLPYVYHEMDSQGHLEDFLDAFQATVEEIHEDEKDLRKIQGIWTTPWKYLRYIARSLGWKLSAESEESQRNEAATIVDFYDLKGTPYGIRLISKLTLNKFFQRLIELYTPTPASASEITETASDELQYLIDDNGEFVNAAWDPTLGGTGYDFDKRYSYIVFMRVFPDDYTYGEIRPRIQAFKDIIHTMHPAGRYCYPYIICNGTKAEDYEQIQYVYEELTGLKTYDDTRTFDDGGSFDENDDPIDPSVSTHFYYNLGNLDTLDSQATPQWDEFDTDDGAATPDWERWDDGVWGIYGIFQIN